MANYVDKIMERIMENTNTTTNLGIIIASPSEDPPYKYHWIRDSALVMRPIIDMFKKTQDSKYFQHIINYIENETKIQKLNTISGLGEPKINIDGTPFNGDWGRPQNDGPALRGIILLEIVDILKYKYSILIENMVGPIINNDLEYILNNYNKVCYDIWEENIGWHFYTRLVQLKFLKDCIYNYKHISFTIELDKIKEVYDKLLINIKDHFNENTIISSFNEKGEIIKYEDSANILAFCHIKYDKEILEKVPFEYIKHTCTNLINYFRSKYNNQDLNLIGRYKDDKYYNGHIWIICSLALAQVYLEMYKQSNIIRKTSPMHRAKSNPNNDYMIIANEILERILSLDTDFILPEQFDPITNKYYSAKKLTWNYSELYILITQLM